MIPASSGVGATSLIKGIPGIGTAVSLLTMPTLSMGATYAIGMAFIQHFATGGTLLDFNPPDYHEFLKAETGQGPRRRRAERLTADYCRAPGLRRLLRIPPPQRRECRHAVFRQLLRPARTGPSARCASCRRSIAARRNGSTTGCGRARWAAATRSSWLLAKTTLSIIASTAGFLMPMTLSRAWLIGRLRAPISRAARCRAAAIHPRRR